MILFFERRSKRSKRCLQQFMVEVEQKVELFFFSQLRKSERENVSRDKRADHFEQFTLRFLFVTFTGETIRVAKC